jgi:hypothetical protein
MFANLRFATAKTIGFLHAANTMCLAAMIFWSANFTGPSKIKDFRVRKIVNFAGDEKYGKQKTRC